MGGLADLKAELQIGLDDLHGVRRDLTEAEAYQNDFPQGAPAQTGQPRSTTALGTTLKVLVLLLIMVAEFVANGYFLARGNELGLIGGVVQAAVFALPQCRGGGLYRALLAAFPQSQESVRQALGRARHLRLHRLELGAQSFPGAFREVEGQLLGNAGNEVIGTAGRTPVSRSMISSRGSCSASASSFR